MEYTNSKLVNVTKLSPNHSGTRTHIIDRITPHCVVGQCSVERICDIFYPEERVASCNYCIGEDGRIGMCVEEKNRSWCSSSNSNDQRAITIECASERTHPYEMKAEVMTSLVNLCVDICKRNGKTELLWFDDKDKSLSYEPKENEMVITVHRWFANKSCPGDWLYNRLGELAKRVTEALGEDEIFRVQTGAFMNKAYADAHLEKVKDAGFSTYMVKDDKFYKVQTGAFRVKEYANAQMERLKSAGFDAFITSEGGTPATPTTPPKKSVDHVALEVIKGKWGNGADRKRRLKEAGYNYSEVQKRVNELL